MKPYSEHQPTGFDSKGAFLPERQDWLVLPVSRTRDTGPFQESNFETALTMLGGESETVEVHRFGHWGPGWYEIILVQPGTEAEKIANEIEARLENYPLLDDDDHSKREYECYLESWDSWARRDYSKAIRKELFVQFPDGVSEEFSDNEIEDLVSELSDEDIDSLRDAAAQKVNWEYQADGDGVSINVKGLVDSTDFDRLADMTIESGRQSLVSGEITKLARLLGAGKQAIQLAIQYDFRSVSLLQNLILTQNN